MVSNGRGFELFCLYIAIVECTSVFVYVLYILDNYVYSTHDMLKDFSWDYNVRVGVSGAFALKTWSKNQKALLFCVCKYYQKIRANVLERHDTE